MSVDQLTFWDAPLTEKDVFENKIEDLKQQQNNLRKGMFSRYALMKEEISILHEEISYLKSILKPKNATIEFEEQFFQQVGNL